VGLPEQREGGVVLRQRQRVEVVERVAAARHQRIENRPVRPAAVGGGVEDGGCDVAS
jgi:hypothetical protein